MSKAIDSIIITLYIRMDFFPSKKLCFRMIRYFLLQNELAEAIVQRAWNDLMAKCTRK